MTPELLTLIARRAVDLNALGQLPKVSQAIRARSPILAERYRRLLEESGALSNPETTPEEREALAAALEGETQERTAYIRIRLTPAEDAELRRRADDAGLTLSAFVRARCLE